MGRLNWTYRCRTGRSCRSCTRPSPSWLQGLVWPEQWLPSIRMPPRGTEHLLLPSRPSFSHQYNPTIAVVQSRNGLTSIRRPPAVVCVSSCNITLSSIVTASIGVKGQNFVASGITGKARPDLRPIWFHSCRRRQRLQRGCVPRRSITLSSSMCPLVEPGANRDLRWEEFRYLWWISRMTSIRNPGYRQVDATNTASFQFVSFFYDFSRSYKTCVRVRSLLYTVGLYSQ